MFRVICVVLVSLAVSAVAQRSPTISYISQEQIKDIGGSVEFACSVQYAQDYPVIWARIDKSKTTEPVHLSYGTTLVLRESRYRVQFRNDTSTYTLSVGEIQETDAGYYRCQIVISPTNKITAEVELQVRRPPIIFDNSTRSLVVVESQNVTLECYAGGFPPPTISWRRDNNQILPTGGSVYRGNILPIGSVNKDHRGTYYCVAENGVGRGARRNIFIEVQFTPVVTATRKRVGQALQFDMDLECKIEAYPPPAIVWYKEGDTNSIANNQHYLVSHFTTDDEITFTVIRIITIEKRQFGNYTCRAINIFGQAQANIELFETVIPMCPPACAGNPSN
ncbi:lachesin-like [Planococcus citri]|uniref:lachesin-like n=1 Tax=Planococcus citri TaxID=170843 RepID=UPI0031F92E12